MPIIPIAQEKTGSENEFLLKRAVKIVWFICIYCLVLFLITVAVSSLEKWIRKLRHPI
jgi:hypothetical protein